MKTLYNIGDGSLKVAKSATKEIADKLIKRLKDENNDEYFLSDKDLAVRYKIKTPMVKKIREAAGIAIREDRIIRVLRSMPIANMYIDSILVSLKGRISYNTLYVLMRNNGLEFMRKNKVSGGI